VAARGDSAPWTNWSQTVHARPAATVVPRSEADLVAIVRRAGAEGMKVRAVGAGHSGSEVAVSDGGHLVRLDRYDRVVSVDAEAMRVTVQAGVRLGDLNDHLAGHGLALTNLGSIADQTLAGAISTGTHGTGLRYGAIDQQVVAMTLVTAGGELLTLNARRESDVLLAARVGLGSLGIISTLTVQCVPSFDMAVSTECVSFDDALAGLDSLVTADHSRLWWFPNTDAIQVWRARRVGGDEGAGRVGKPPTERTSSGTVHELGLWATSFVPALTPVLNRRLQRHFYSGSGEARGRSDHLLTFPITMRQRVLEFGIPIEHASAALRRLRDAITRNGLTAHSPVEVRFAPANDAWLSMAFGRDTCYIGVIVYRPFGRSIAHERYFRATDALMTEFGGRPHWGKVHFHDAAALRRLYPEWDRFQALRRRLDPKGMFLNRHLAGLFGEG
jgi:sugar-1,4-lactone oxidase-like protein